MKFSIQLSNSDESTVREMQTEIAEQGEAAYKEKYAEILSGLKMAGIKINLFIDVRVAANSAEIDVESVESLASLSLNFPNGILIKGNNLEIL